MIYSKTENPKCCICTNAQKSSAGNVSCALRGTVPEDFCCKKFKYDIFKKTVRPKRTLHKDKFSEKDFSL